MKADGLIWVMAGILIFCLCVFGIPAVSAWKIETVESNPLGTYQGGTSIAVDSSGSPIIAYSYWLNGSVHYAEKTGGIWQVTPVSLQLSHIVIG